MESEKKYIVRLDDGEELGPMDQYALINLAETGKVTATCRVRNALIPDWDKALSVDFLHDILIGQVEKQVMEKLEEQSSWEKMKKQMALRGDADPFSSIAQEGMTLSKGGIFSRFFAALLDLFFVALGGAGIVGICALLFRNGIVGGGIIAYLAAIMMLLWIVFYYVGGWSLRSQTVGQRFFGLVLICADRSSLYPGRAFVYLVLLCLFGVLTPFGGLLTLGRGSLQEWATSTRVCRFVRARGLVR